MGILPRHIFTSAWRQVVTGRRSIVEPPRWRPVRPQDCRNGNVLCRVGNTLISIGRIAGTNSVVNRIAQDRVVGRERARICPAASATRLR